MTQAKTQIVFQLGDKNVLMRQERGAILSTGGTHFHLCREANIVMLILNNVFNFQSGNHQSYSYNFCFLVILANGSLGHCIALDSVQRLFSPGLTFQRFEA